jgi:hypothetical protein
MTPGRCTCPKCIGSTVEGIASLIDRRPDIARRVAEDLARLLREADHPDTHRPGADRPVMVRQEGRA